MGEEKTSSGVIDSVASLVHSLYTLFILRDVCGKIAPGALILVTLWFLRAPIGVELSVSADTDWPAWLILLGVCWVLGLAMQGLGESVWILKRVGNDLDFEPLRVKFRKGAVREQQYDFERLVVVKEASGNAGVALALSLLMLFLNVVHNWPPVNWFWPSLLLVVVGIAVFGLLRMHRFAYAQAMAYMHAAVTKPQCTCEPALPNP